MIPFKGSDLHPGIYVESGGLHPGLFPLYKHLPSRKQLVLPLRSGQGEGAGKGEREGGGKGGRQGRMGGGGGGEWGEEVAGKP